MGSGNPNQRQKPRLPHHSHFTENCVNCWAFTFLESKRAVLMTRECPAWAQLGQVLRKRAGWQRKQLEWSRFTAGLRVLSAAPWRGPDTLTRQAGRGTRHWGEPLQPWPDELRSVSPANIQRCSPEFSVPHFHQKGGFPPHLPHPALQAGGQGQCAGWGGRAFGDRNYGS